MTPDVVLELTPAIKCEARRLVGGTRRAREWTDLRDVEQAAYVACLRALPRYDGTTKLTTFLSQRIRGAMIDTLRQWHPRVRRTGRPHVVWVPLEREHTERPADARSPIDLLLDADIRRLVAELPPRHRLLVERHYFEGARLVDVARELGLSQGRIWQLHAEALTLLRRRV